MTFSPGDQVHIAAVGKGVVREVRNGGRYLVDVKGRSIVVDGAQLGAVEQRKRRNKSERASDGSTFPESLFRSHAAASLDLHGMTAPEAVVALDAFVSDAILAGLGEVRVIHGRSGRRLKAVIHARLRVLPTVRQFRVDPTNAGVTIVGL